MNIEYPQIYNNLARQEHLLIGGTTGAGKTTVINGILTALCCTDSAWVLIDPKGSELVGWRNCKKCIMYAVKPGEVVGALERCTELMQERYANRPEKDLYIIIDEYAFIRSQCRKAESYISDIAFRGRSAGVHLIIATQRPTRDVVGGLVRGNMTATLCLRTSTPTESRNLIDIRGAEDLPRYGKGIYKTPDEVGLVAVELPMIPPETVQELQSYLQRPKSELMMHQAKETVKRYYRFLWRHKKAIIIIMALWFFYTLKP